MNDSSVLGNYARKHRKMLPGNHLRRVASIGVREKRFSPEQASFRTKLDEQREVKNVCQPEEVFEGALHCRLTTKKAKTATSLLEDRKFDLCMKDRKADLSGKSERKFSFFHRSRVDSDLCRFSKPIFESNDKASLSTRRIAFQKPKSNFDFPENATRFPSSTSSGEGFYSDNEMKNMSSRSNKKPNAGHKQRKYGGHKMESNRQTSRLSREISYWMRKKTSHGSASSYDSSVIERPRNQNRLEVIRSRWFLKKPESDSWQEHSFSKKRSNITDQPRTLRNNFVEIDLSDRVCQSLNSRFYSSSTKYSCIKGEKWAMKKPQENEVKVGHLFEGNSTLLKSSSMDPQEHNHEHEPEAWIFSGKEDDSSSYLSNASVQQAAASTGFQEEGSDNSHCSDTVPESLVSLDEAYQSSPVSVLQPLCKQEASSGAQSMKNVGIDVGDLRLQLELLVSEPGMNGSTEEDSEGRSEQKFDQNEDVMRFLKSDDSRDFAYLVDVLTEVCFHGKNLDLGFGNWHSPESPIGMSVFETLEKKFGEQIVWKRSERRLLFDRINSGLVEILQSLVCVPKWAKPVSRRFGNWPSQETLEDELWVWIDDQKRDMSKNLQKSLSLGLWETDIGENIDAICRELVSSMMDELAEEFVEFIE